MKHAKNAYNERAQYCHIQCYHKDPIQKLSKFETMCSRCHSLIEINSPIEKWETKWAHVGCKEATVKAINSSYEQLMKACLIMDDIDDVDTQITEQSQQSAQQSSQQYTALSQQSPLLSIDSNQFSQLTHDAYDDETESTRPEVIATKNKVGTKRKVNDDVLSLMKRK